jgi:hypothetical protein
VSAVRARACARVHVCTCVPVVVEKVHGGHEGGVERVGFVFGEIEDQRQ